MTTIPEGVNVPENVEGEDATVPTVTEENVNANNTDEAGVTGVNVNKISEEGTTDNMNNANNNDGGDVDEDGEEDGAKKGGKKQKKYRNQDDGGEVEDGDEFDEIEIDVVVEDWLDDIYPEDYLICEFYQLKGGQFLGRTRDSEIRQATDVRTGQQVAIKRYSLNDEDEEVNIRRWQKFNYMIKAHHFLEHAHAVVVYCFDYTRDEDNNPSSDIRDHSCYIVMELGAYTLHDYLTDRRTKSEDGGVTIEEVYELFLSFTEILVAIHREGCVHLNLTPSAIVQTSVERKWKLLDVERVRKSNSSISPIDATLDFVPLYMAPELAIAIRSARLSVRIAQSMDVFSMGLILAELLVNKPVMKEKQDACEDHDFLHFLCEPEVEIPLEVRRFDTDFYNVLKQMLSLRPHERITVFDLLKSAFYIKSINTEMDPELERAIHLEGVTANKERRGLLQCQVFEKNCDLRNTCNFKTLRDSMIKYDEGKKQTRYVVAPQGYDPHDYHDIELIHLEAPGHQPELKVPEEPQNIHEDVMNNNVLRETEADRDPLFKHRPRLSWNFKKTPLFQSPDDYFYKTSESDREYGPFTAAQMTVWLERGNFDGHLIGVRKRKEDQYQSLALFISEITTIGNFQLHSTEYSPLLP